jgi:hypothetical protein
MSRLPLLAVDVSNPGLPMASGEKAGCRARQAILQKNTFE